jgi:hypothetical protein
LLVLLQVPIIVMRFHLVPLTIIRKWDLWPDGYYTTCKRVLLARAPGAAGLFRDSISTR